MFATNPAGAAGACNSVVVVGAGVVVGASGSAVVVSPSLTLLLF